MNCLMTFHIDIFLMTEHVVNLIIISTINSKTSSSLRALFTGEPLSPSLANELISTSFIPNFTLHFEHTDEHKTIHTYQYIPIHTNTN